MLHWNFFDCLLSHSSFRQLCMILVLVGIKVDLRVGNFEWRRVSLLGLRKRGNNAIFNWDETYFANMIPFTRKLME